MTATRLYDRVVRVTLARPLEGDYFKTATANGVIVSDLRVVFRVEKSLASDPNTASVTLYNLSPDSRELLEKRPVHVRIEAGHDNDPRRLFVGDMIHNETHADQVDIPTTLQIGDGARAYRFARVPPRAFRAGVDVRTLVVAAAQSMGLKVPTSAAGAVELSKQMASGYTLEGAAPAQLTGLLKPVGLGWSVQDGQLQILRDDEVRADEAVLVNEDTGMIGAPVYGAPQKAGDPPTLTVKMLLYPGLTPGGRIKVQSQHLNGVFKMRRVMHNGDTHGPDWYSEIEATPR